MSLEYCNGLALGGYTDWRLPNKKELESIVDYTTSLPAMNAVFTGPYASLVTYYWSSTSFFNDPYRAWHVHFAKGSVSYSSKTGPYSARCVR